MTIKGQKLKIYSEELKMEAIRLHVDEKWTYRPIPPLVVMETTIGSVPGDSNDHLFFY